MKKTLIALAAVAVSTAAMSQATLSGALRIGVLNNDNGTTVTPNQGSGNYVNIGVTEDLGGGMKFVGKTHLRFDAANGSFTELNGAASGSTGFQTTSIGISGGFGTIEMGRIGLNQQWGYNPFGSNSAHLNPVSAGGATENGQIRYTAPTMSGFTVSLTNTQALATTAGLTNGHQVLVSYNAGAISATVVSEELTSGVTHKSFGASYDLGVAKIMMISGNQKTIAGVKSADGNSLSVQVPMGAFTFKAGKMNDKMTANLDKTAFGVDYALGKRTTLEMHAYKTSNETTVLGQNVWVGARHSF